MIKFFNIFLSSIPFAHIESKAYKIAIGANSLDRIQVSGESFVARRYRPRQKVDRRCRAAGRQRSQHRNEHVTASRRDATRCIESIRPRQARVRCATRVCVDTRRIHPRLFATIMFPHVSRVSRALVSLSADASACFSACCASHARTPCKHTTDACPTETIKLN